MRQYESLTHIEDAVLESIRAGLDERDEPESDRPFADGIEPLQPITLSLKPPRQTTPLSDFLGIVQRIENRLGEPLSRNTRHMITVFRKAFYDNRLWNLWMIPGTARVEQVLAADEIAQLLAARDAMAPDETASDLGHTLVGMDAANHPGCIPLHLCPTEHAATWLGDLGSILTGMRHAAKDDPPATDEAMRLLWANQIKEQSPGIDVLGDIDGIVAGLALSVGSPAGGLKVSELLREYYGDGRPNRFAIFANHLGLGTLVDGHFENEPAFLSRFTPAVHQFAVLFFIGADETKRRTEKRFGDPFISRKASAHVLNAFVACLRQACEARALSERQKGC